MVLRRQAHRLHGEMFERQQQFGAIFQQQIHVATRKGNRHLGILHFRMRILKRAQIVGKLKASVIQQRVQKLVQLRPQRVDGIFHAIYFLTVLLTGALDGGAGGGAGVGMNLLMMSC